MDSLSTDYRSQDRSHKDPRGVQARCEPTTICGKDIGNDACAGDHWSDCEETPEEARNEECFNIGC